MAHRWAHRHPSPSGWVAAATAGCRAFDTHASGWLHRCPARLPLPAADQATISPRVATLRDVRQAAPCYARQHVMLNYGPKCSDRKGAGGCGDTLVLSHSARKKQRGSCVVQQPTHLQADTKVCLQVLQRQALARLAGGAMPCLAPDAGGRLVLAPIAVLRGRVFTAGHPAVISVRACPGPLAQGRTFSTS